MTRSVNDFRIGNLVLDEDGELCKIEQLSSEKMECFQQVSNIENKSCISTKYPSNIYAIELTEEWLKKAGFEHKSGNEYVKDRFTYRKSFSDLVINGYEFDYNGIICYPRYVHQLQNLYFALCGEDLVFSTEP